jgi:hypothetical protein
MKLAWLYVIVLARAASAQLGPCATPLGADLPDLIINRHALRADRLLSDESIETNSCELIEGCVRAAGQRQLLRFTVAIPNVGATALVIGDPSQCSLLFHFSECHGHYHLEQFADYRLWTRAGFKAWRRSRVPTEPASSPHNAGLLASLLNSGDLLAGRKQGFCMVDSVPFPANAKNPSPRVFDDCLTQQGISAGWSDNYRADLDCQFIDVTGAPSGRYILEVEVNPDRVLPESEYANNSTHVNVKIPSSRRLDQ